MNNDLLIELINNLNQKAATQDAVIANMASVLNQLQAHQAPPSEQTQTSVQESWNSSRGVQELIEPEPRNQPLENQLRQHVVRDFVKLNPPTFEGQMDPLLADEWLAKVMKTMDLLEMNDAERVQAAAYLFCGDARLWWDTLKRQRNNQPLSWDMLLDEFRAKYLNARIRGRYHQELINFKQGSLTVPETVAKF